MTDDRDWTSVQTEPCPECRFEPGELGAAELPAAVRDLGRKYRAPLSRFLQGEDGAALVRTRPEPEVWSPLEYACHVRDLLAVFAGRVERTVAEDNPVLGWWDHEGAVEAEHYQQQDPTSVADDLAANAETLAAALENVPADGWDRTAERRAGEIFTVLGLGRFAVHEGRHHLLDIGRGLRTARGR